jgi:protein-tyrosine phosphatase/arsenate reductase
MNASLKLFAEHVTNQFAQIPNDRKEKLMALVNYVREKHQLKEGISLVFICTHNSRRSHFGQVMCAFAAAYYGISNVHTYSAGTEETAFHPHAIEALQTIGFNIEQLDQRVNPQYRIHVSESVHSDCFSKTISHESLPKNHFAAIMTCSDAEQNCPFVPGAEKRIGITYEDPKAFDGTEFQSAKYLERATQIATELFYVFSQLNA